MAPQVIDKGMPTAGLVAHTTVSRFVDHIPYYRQEQINARSGVHTPRSTLAAWGGHTGAQLMPLYEAHRGFVLGSRVLHADETPIALLDPGRGKTRKAFMWAYARGAFDPDARPLSAEQRLLMRQERSQPLWEELHLWLKLERMRVPDGSAIAKAIDYSLNHWEALSQFLLDGAVPIDNNHLENQMRPWAM